jgi:hypothetical protein
MFPIRKTLGSAFSQETGRLTAIVGIHITSSQMLSIYHQKRHRLSSLSTLVTRIETVPDIFLFDNVTYRTIARQRLGKRIPAEVNARKNITSTTRQRISQHASLTTEAVFCVVRAKWL